LSSTLTRPHACEELPAASVTTTVTETGSVSAHVTITASVQSSTV